MRQGLKVVYYTCDKIIETKTTIQSLLVLLKLVEQVRKEKERERERIIQLTIQLWIEVFPNF